MAGQARLTLGFSLVLVSILGGAWASAGCGRLREKQAVRRYALDAREVERRAEEVRSLVTDLDALRSSPHVERLSSFLRERFLPALRGLVEAVRRLPTEAARLRRIKDPLLGAAERALEACETLADRVGGGPLEGVLARIAEALDGLLVAVRVHDEALDAACQDHDLRRREK